MRELLILISILIGFFNFSGCSRIETGESNLSQKPTGECPDCAKYDKSSVECGSILTVYQDNGASFFTNQVYRLCLCDGSMLITTRLYDQETVLRLVSDNNLKAVKGGTTVADSPLKVFNSEIVNLIGEMLAANGNYSILSTEPVNVYGQWFRQAQGLDSSLIYYVNVDNNLVDLIGSDNYIVRGYDFRDFEAFEHLVPTTLEVFRSGTNVSAGEKLMKLEFDDFILSD